MSITVSWYITPTTATVLSITAPYLPFYTCNLSTCQQLLPSSVLNKLAGISLLFFFFFTASQWVITTWIYECVWSAISGDNKRESLHLWHNASVVAGSRLSNMSSCSFKKMEHGVWFTPTPVSSQPEMRSLGKWTQKQKHFWIAKVLQAREGWSNISFMLHVVLVKIQISLLWILVKKRCTSVLDSVVTSYNFIQAGLKSIFFNLISINTLIVYWAVSHNASLCLLWLCRVLWHCSCAANELWLVYTRCLCHSCLINMIHWQYTPIQAVLYHKNWS